MKNTEIEKLIKAEMAKSLTNYIGKPYNQNDMKVFYDELNNKLSLNYSFILPVSYLTYTFSFKPLQKIKYICY